MNRRQLLSPRILAALAGALVFALACRLKLFRLAGRWELETLAAYERCDFGFVRFALKRYYAGVRPARPLVGEAVAGRPRVFFVANTMSLWRKPVSSHLKLLVDTAEVFIRHGYEVQLLLTVHPYLSVFSHEQLEIRDFLGTSPTAIRDCLARQCRQISGIDPEKLGIRILGTAGHRQTLRQYVEQVDAEFADLALSTTDLLFSVSGVYGCDLVHSRAANLPCRKLLMMFHFKNEIDDSMARGYDVALSTVPERVSFTGARHQLEVRRVKYRVSPFAWELKSDGAEHARPSADLDRIARLAPDRVLVAARWAIARVIDSAFRDILAGWFQAWPAGCLVLIGDDEAVVHRAVADERIPADRVIVLPFVDSLYAFYRELAARFVSIYALPRCAGSGQSTVFAVLAGLPVALHCRNDAEAYLPQEIFAESYAAYGHILQRLSDDEAFRLGQVESARAHINHNNAEVDRFFLSFLSESLPPELESAIA